MIVALLACEEEPEAPPHFAVIGVQPEDGAADVVEVTPVFLRFNATPDTERCTADFIEINAIRADGTVAFAAPAEVSRDGEYDNLKVASVEPFMAGWAYAVTVQGGEDGCADVDGRPVTPFLSTFEVP